MASDKIYRFIIGQVQQFKDQPVVAIREANGSEVREFTIKNLEQKLAKVTLWPDTAPGVEIKANAQVSGTFEVKKNGDYINLTAYSITVQNPEDNAEREDRQVVRKERTTSEVDF